MTRNCLVAFLACLAALLLPGTARAQSCYVAYCSSDIEYDASSQEIYGYSRSWDYYWGVGLDVDSYLEEWGSEEPVTSEEDCGWDDVTAYVNGYASPGQTYYVDADHYYSFEWYEAGWSYDGYSESEDVAVQGSDYPSGDDTAFYSDFANGVNGGVWGAIFKMTLYPPSTTAYEGGTIDEYLDVGTYDDSCHDQVIGYYAVPSPFRTADVFMGVYGDQIYIGDDWVRFYSDLERRAALTCPCGWTVYQSVYFDDYPLDFNWQGIDVDGYFVTTNRGGVARTVSGP